MTAAMIAGWTETFFHKRALESSVVDSGVMLATAATDVATMLEVDQVAQTTALLPLSWLVLATVLATPVWRRNSSDGQSRS